MKSKAYIHIIIIGSITIFKYYPTRFSVRWRIQALSTMTRTLHCGKGSTLWTHQEAREGKYNCHSCEGKRGDTHHILTECRTTRASRDALRDQVEELLTRWMKPNLPEESTIKTHWRELAWERAPARLTSLQWMIMAGNQKYQEHRPHSRRCVVPGSDSS